MARRFKQAALTHLVAGPVGHLAVNALGRAAHHGSNLAEVLAHKGLQHGMTDAVVNPAAARTIRSLLGPEALGAYEMAHSMGRRLSQSAPLERASLLASAAAAPISEKTPLAGSLIQAAKHELAGTSPTLTSKGVGAGIYSKAVDALTNVVDKPFDTGLQKVVKSVAGGTPLAALAVADPVGSAAHTGINAARELLSETELGKNFYKQELNRGLTGVQRPVALEVAGDYLASPALQDAYRMGRSLREQTPENLRSLLTNENLQRIGVQADPLTYAGLQNVQKRAL